MQASLKRLEIECIAEEAAALRGIRGGARRAGASQKLAMNWLRQVDEDM